MDLLDSEENPVFQKMPGADNVGVELGRPATCNENNTDGLEKTEVFSGKMTFQNKKET